MKPGEFAAFKTLDGRFGWRATAIDTDGQPPIKITESERAASPASPKPGKRKALVEQARAGALPSATDFS